MRGTEYGLAKDGKGMSLVEIIIAVAIMSLIIGIAGYGLSLSSGKPAERYAQKLVSIIQQARTATMGKKKTVLTIKNDGEVTQVVTTINDLGEEVTIEEPKPLLDASEDVSIEIRRSGMDDSTLVPTLELEFNRANGALLNVDGTAEEDYMPTIKVSKGNTTRLIEIFPLTGKVSLSTMP